MHRGGLASLSSGLLVLVGMWVLGTTLEEILVPTPDYGPQPVDADMSLGILEIIVPLSLLVIGSVFVWAAWRGHETGDPRVPTSILLGIVGWYLSVHVFEVFSVFPDTQFALGIVLPATILPAVVTWVALDKVAGPS